MNETDSGGPVEDKRSWTTETLPLSTRQQLLERELARLGFRKSGTASASQDRPAAQQQQQQQQQPQSSPSDRPGAGDTAKSPDGAGHAD